MSNAEVYRTYVENESPEETEYYTSCDSIVHKNGCAAGVMALRKCFELLLVDHTDNHFTGRLMKLVSRIFRCDQRKGIQKRSVLFSQQKEYLSTIEFNIWRKNVGGLLHQFEISHTDSRAEASISVKGLWVPSGLMIKSATHFRILHHLSIVSDYRYSKSHRRYEPLSMLNGMSAIGYSAFFPVELNPDLEVRVEFPDGVCPLEEDTVIQCVGLEFFSRSGSGYSLLYGGGGVEVFMVY